MVSGVAFRRTRGPSRRTRRASWREERQSGMWLRTLIETAQSKEASRKGRRWASAAARRRGEGGRLCGPQLGGGAADHARCEVAKGDAEAGAGEFDGVVAGAAADVEQGAAGGRAEGLGDGVEEGGGGGPGGGGGV